MSVDTVLHRWVCSASNEVVELPFGMSEVGSLLMRVNLERLKQIERVGLVVGLHWGDSQVVAVHYNSRSETMVLDGGRNEEKHIRVSSSDVLFRLSIGLSSVSLQVDSYVKGENYVQTHVSSSWHAEHSMARAVGPVDILRMGGRQRGPNDGWTPPYGAEFELFQYGFFAAEPGMVVNIQTTAVVESARRLQVEIQRFLDRLGR